MSILEEFIKEAFGSQYIIPVYQRNYTWKKNKQVEQLLEDIEDILKENKKRHFIGTIVYNIVNTNFMVRERGIVDGQQRLITIFLITYALRNIARECGESDIAEVLTTSYLENPTNNKYRFRMQPSVSDDDAYSYIANDKIEKYNGQSLVMSNYKYILAELRRMANNYTLLAVINAIREMYIVRIELDDSDDAQQIFESINSTGEKLNSADLIRNFIMMGKSNEEQEYIYNKYWLELEKKFPESKKLSEFFRFYIATKKYILISEKELYNGFKLFWKEHNINYISILDEIIVFADHFYRLYLSKDANDELGEQLLDYRNLQSLMPAPFAMSVLEHLRVGNITRYQAVSVFKVLDTYLIRRYLCGQDTSAISRFFPGYLKKVEERLATELSFDNYEEICIYLLINENMSKSAFMPDDKQLRSYLKNENAYVLQNIRLVLDKIESYNNPVKVDLTGLSIEHIMPQTQNAYWKSISNLNEDEYVKVVNTIGNLTLAAVTDNSKMGNRNFDSKKAILESTRHLKLNEYILQSNNWTVVDIMKRSDMLIDKIITIYPYIKSTKDIIAKEQSREIYLNMNGIKAYGYLNKNESVVVYAGSEVSFLLEPTRKKFKLLRLEFVGKGIVKDNHGVYKLTSDIVFDSPSAAADFLLGSSRNGWLCWKDLNGCFINDTLRIFKE